MDFRAWQTQVVAYLDGLLALKVTVKGGRRRLLDALDLPVSFFGGLRRRVKTPDRRIPLDDVFEVLESLGEHPVVVLYEAGRRVDRELPPLPQERNRLAELPAAHCVRQFTALLKEGEPPPEGRQCIGQSLRGYGTWRRLVRLAQSEPLTALAQGEWALKLAAKALGPRILAVLGTALRRTDDLEGAFAALDVAEHHANQWQDRWAIADIWQRRCYVLLAAGEPEQALDLAQAATGKYLALGQLGDAGRATVDQGVFLAVLERQEEAIEAFRGALKVLPPGEHDNRFIAMNNIARAYCELGKLRVALDWTKGVTSYEKGRVADLMVLASWETRGLLAYQLGDLQQAESAFRHCVKEYEDRSAFLDSALSRVWLCRSLLARGYVQECWDMAHEGSFLIGKLRSSKVAAAAIATLVVEARRSRELNDGFLEGIALQLTEARGWRPIGTPPNS